MEYKEMDLIVPQDYADLASLILCECGSQGTVLHDDENRGDDVRITAYFSASDTGESSRSATSCASSRAVIRAWAIGICPLRRPTTRTGSIRGRIISTPKRCRLISGSSRRGKR